MRTPKIYTDNLANGIITKPMLSDCLFSVNKRAKNYRNKEREYRHYRFNYYHNEEKNREKKEEFYSKKEKLLKLLQPECIHEETVTVRERFYDYESEYDYYLSQDLFIYENEYYDNDMMEFVCFGDAYVEEQKYYLFYDLGEHSFHTPIDEEQLENYPSLQVKKIDALVTSGKETTELVSMQFVKKVLELVDTGEYILQ